MGNRRRVLLELSDYIFDPLHIVTKAGGKALA